MIELNKVFLSARLTRDPEMRYLPTGTAVCKMGVAADRSYAGRDSQERQKETLFIDVTAWAKTAEFCNQYMRKGSAIFVEGRLRYESWKDKETGATRSRISIVADRVQFGESRAEAEQRAARGGSGGGGRDYGGGGGDDHGGYDGGPPDETADDLPF